MAHNVLDIAKRIISYTDVENGDTISNLKLQKILYYMQGFWLAIFDKPLFDEDIEAWMYGPVVPSVYEYFRGYGSHSIMPDDVRESFSIELNNDEEDLFFSVLEEYGQFSAVKLMNMTHEEIPWKSTQTGKGNIISKKILKDYFSTQVDYA